MSGDTTLSRRERERLRRRRAIVRAARTVFAEKGYRQATLEEIAERAEFGKGTLYNYFEGGKEELLFAVLDDVYDSLCELAEELLSEDLVDEHSSQEIFHRYISATIDHLMEHQDLFMLLIKEAHRMAFDEEEEKVEYFRRQNQRLKDLMMPAIEAGIARGQLKDFPPQIIAGAILGNMNGYLMEACRKDEGSECTAKRPDPTMAARFISTMLFDGLSTDRDR